MSTNIYICHTEYHFMICLHIAYVEYLGEDFNNIIHITKSNSRFNNIFIPELTGNITIKIHDKISEVDLVRTLTAKTCHRFFFCQENDIFNRFIAYQLKRKSKSIICLVQDGYKPYVVFNKKHEYLSMLKDSLIDYKRLIKNKLYSFKLFKADYYRYGSTNFIDEVWLTNVDQFNAERNKCKARLVPIPHFDQTTIRNIEKYFKFSDDDWIERENIILYINQPFWTSELIKKEIGFLHELIQHFKRTVYLKLHPGTSNEMIEKYKLIDGLSILTSVVPAEFYILDIRKSIIFSGWSTALITNNSSCNYYFNLPIYKNCGAHAIEQSVITILPHIRLVHKPQEMTFPT